jgi:hypothetical protein
MNRMHLILFDIDNRVFGPCMAATDRKEKRLPAARTVWLLSGWLGGIRGPCTFSLICLSARLVGC